MAPLFCSGVQQEYLPGLQCVHESVVVQHLACHRGDGGEGEVGGLSAGGDAPHRCGHLCLVHSRAHHPVGLQVHLGGDVNRRLNGFYLLGALVAAHVGHRKYQLNVGSRRHGRWILAHQGCQLQRVLRPVRGKIADFAPLRGRPC